MSRATPKPGDRILVRGLIGEEEFERPAVVERVEGPSRFGPRGLVARTVIGDELSRSLTWVALDSPSWSWPDDR